MTELYTALALKLAALKTHALPAVAGGLVSLAAYVWQAAHEGFSATSIGVTIISSGVLTAVVLKLVDVFWEARKLKKAEQTQTHSTFATTTDRDGAYRLRARPGDVRRRPPPP